MTACSLINFAINPQLLKEKIDSIIKSDRPNKYLNVTKSIYRKLPYSNMHVARSGSWIKVRPSWRDRVASELAPDSLTWVDTNLSSLQSV